MTIVTPPIVKPTGATSFLLEFGQRIDRDLSIRITRFVASLPGNSPFVSVIPSYTTVGISIDPMQTTVEEASAELVDRWMSFVDHAASDSNRHVTIPMVYGGEMGPDLADVAKATGLSPDDIIRKHSEAEYLVAAVGFAAGFSFLLGLPPELAVPRRANPRVIVPAGSLGIGGAQTGVYPVDSPGGWNLIGRTPWRLFDPNGNTDVELRVGDYVHFDPIDERDFLSYQSSVSEDDPAITLRRDIEIEDAGLQTSVQDLGRHDQAHLGVAPSGAMDPSALVAGNRLLGNQDSSAAIEWALIPPKIRFSAHANIVLTGADPGWELDGHPITVGQVVEVRSGSILQATRISELFGARGYICVRGGVDVPLLLGSRSLDDVAQFGGGVGRYLKKGDFLPVGDAVEPISAGEISVDRSIPVARPFRIIRGPQADRFSSEIWNTLVQSPYTVDSKSNRVGARLNGPDLVPENGGDVISEPNVTGVIQVTGSGQPIILLSGRATIGGYTKIATVIEADHDRLGQLGPGDIIRFEEVDLHTAKRELAACTPSVFGGVTQPAMKNESKSDGLEDVRQQFVSSGDWELDDLVRLFQAAADAGVTSFSLNSDHAQLSFHRGESGGPMLTPKESPVESRQRHIVAAPLIGTFYRRSAPDQPPYCEIGDPVSQESTIGLIEVMKTFHEVKAGHDGMVSQFLVEEGATVEYGQELAEISPETTE